MRLARVLKRTLAAVPTMLGVAVIVFLFMRFSPGDPVEIMMGQQGSAGEAEMAALRQQFHLDEPLWTQLYLFIKGVVQGDLGTSFYTGGPVTDVILQTLPATVELALGALLAALVIGLPVGVLSAVRQNSWIDRWVMAGSFLGISMPAFWLGILAVLLFSVELQLLPTCGRTAVGAVPVHTTGLYTLDSLLAGDVQLFVTSLKYLLLPSLTLGAQLGAIVARVTRSSMLEVLRQDYVTLARAKGVPELRVTVGHVLRNALIPTVTVVGLQVGVLLGGNMIVETVFCWPGLGRLVVQSIFRRDFPVVQGAVMLYALTYVLANLTVDLIYTYLNPKISF